ncbi:class I adenylate-forming enzyme family protein [Virgibacillus pantothenticus]|uniref:class I adenylate-forming enzyme family protein n=1 Tax=Virgibacillus pantothenticus TaxID=1473 RepID=UPI0020B295BD|nr:long-chain-fatty-acid--CoA ligase [Virgibacillus pantothenticus]MEB5451989.1 long-chain-fatty-acid--CoA ligase [Virgibacillus pantothenticus]MEB5456074.1 long-chain-fatty-acid--CoA ligase [Virgibacillus pantothenticus]MEB5460127.1 long-chain-fatty-acid--CoA ligase [Virgibacillus pantothenticus]MEB5464592.1 long-chain-fatty-acid--CoA ligase [Virgibacillus pantothenticus]MEB5468827.1 long-chain-fatty-acid--CoA ligase [Virgibacillus pantothenticus]
MMGSVKQENTTTIQLLHSALNQFPEKEAVYDGTRRLSYRELEEESNLIAAELNKMGVKRGDHIAVCLPNWYEFVVILFAIAKIGAVIVPFNTRYHESEIEYILNHAKVKVAFFTDEVDGNKLWDSFNKVYQQHNYLKHLITVRANTRLSIAYEEVVKHSEYSEFEKVEVSPDDVAIIMYTSGTTGNPKGAMLTHRNVAFTGSVSAEVLKCTSADVFLIQVPMFHIFGMVPGVLAAIAVGAKLVLTQEFKAENALKMVEQEKITVHHAVPTMFILELNHPNLEKYDLTSLRTGIVAAAPVPSEIIRKIREKMHCEVLSSYGMTEASPCLTFCTFEDDDLTRAETVGRAMPGVEVKIINPENGEEAGTGEVGEIVARGPGIMKGYYEMSEKTREVLSEDGWYRTGDLGTMDDKGNLQIVGRKNDLIIRGGFNIYPREIEEHFYKLDEVQEVAIIGLPDTVLGEVACAAVTLKKGAVLTEAKLKLYIKDKVADFKVPDIVTIVEELPMTASGKISKVQLQNKLKEKMAHRLR